MDIYIMWGWEQNLSKHDAKGRTQKGNFTACW